MYSVHHLDICPQNFSFSNFTRVFFPHTPSTSGLLARRNMTATPTAPQQRPSVSEEVATSISTPSTPTSKLTTQETEPKTATEGSARGRVVDQQRKPRRERRLALPAQQRPSERISFAALGRMILQRTGVPISHYEPLTALQLLCEELRYSKLLDNACTKNTAEERMVYVSSFIILKAFKHVRDRAHDRSCTTHLVSYPCEMSTVC
ncbi:hypothetical protein Y032_0101g3415 [Ancylostoma ceylanicum]|uniref:Uncharacterized protein n=1 Tax=Ancylostoma ceylanicum TaxID=53326 RepID=A0A016TI63_9BILA|nr:hypothetical protein Y032_0101g3415 [Ancylostoma ceylanicum]